MADVLTNLGTPFFAVIDFVLDKPLSAVATVWSLAALIVLVVVLT